jgi:hypothetical protein
MGVLMYDNIRLLQPYPFETEQEREAFCSRFGLFVKDEKKGVWHNKGYESLEQNRGIYLKMELPTDKRKGSLTISFSLHKFYNSVRNKGYCNYDDFDFKKANEALAILTELLKVDISNAVVKKYEVGINVATDGNPDEYMKELSEIRIKSRKLRVIEDVHYKEYKQYSTHKDRDKRIVYIFYNKTFEAKSKIKDVGKREAIPDNIMRIEKDIHRPVSTVYFYQLFEPTYQQLEKQEFYQRFVCDLSYKGVPIKTKGITAKQLQLWEMLQEKGEPETKQHFENLWKQGAITRDQHKYAILQIEKIKSVSIKPQIVISEKAEELKQKIISKLSLM